MTIQLIFKIAAVGIVVALIKQGRSGISGEPCRSDYRTDVDYSLCQSAVSGHQHIVWILRGQSMNLGVTMVFAIVAVILALSLKSKNPEYSTFISVAVCLVLLFICVSRMRVMLSGIEVLTDKIRMDSTYLVILVKLIGIAYICEFAASISKDAGYSAVASQIELLGKLTMLVVSLPVFMQVVQTVLSLIN